MTEDFEEKLFEQKTVTENFNKKINNPSHSFVLSVGRGC